MTSRQALSLIIPAYNEEKRLPPTLEIIDAWSRTCPFDLEIIVVDDGSQDRTIDIVKQFQARMPQLRLVQETHVGYMNAIISGFRHASHGFRASLEADCPVHPSMLEGFAAKLGEFDIVLGSRILKDNNSSLEGKSLFRRIISYVSSHLFFFLFNCGVRDPQIGFKLFKAEVLDRILPELRLKHDGLKGSEMIVKAAAYGYRIKEVPVVYKHDEDSRCVPKGNYTVVIQAGLALLDLWALSYAEFRRGILPTLPVRFGFLLGPFWRLVDTGKPTPQHVAPTEVYR